MKKRFIFVILISFFSFNFFSQTVSAISRINWITGEFSSDVELDVVKTGIQMPSEKKSASMYIKSKMPPLIQPSLLSLFEDSQQYLSETVIDGRFSLDQVYEFIMSGYKTPDVFTKDFQFLKTKNTTNILNIEKQLIKHSNSYIPDVPIDYVASREFSGIIIDARGSLSIQGEYIESEVFPCFFPKIWDEEMSCVFEKNLVQPNIITEKGMNGYHFSDDITDYESRVGSDPLYIKAKRVYGRNRTDPIISKKDALKILTIPENVKLLQEGKVVILLDKKNLIYDISVPQKDSSYYVKYGEIKQYFFENKIPQITITDSINGILFSVNLNFYPDSPELLPSEKARIELIAEKLKELLIDDTYTILVEGHTADVGKPIGQLNLSIERTRTVMNSLISEGLNSKLFTYKGYGGTMPIATNKTEEGRAQNRRVDITARPKATYIQRDWK